MKTQCYGTYTEVSMTWGSRWYATNKNYFFARDNFKNKRLNGDEKVDAVGRDWHDRGAAEKSITWIEGEKKSDGWVYGVECGGFYHCTCRYDADEEDLEWMRKTDCNYLKRILKAGDLQKLEPDVWRLREMDHAQNRDIGEWWSEKLKIKNIGDLLGRNIKSLTEQIQSNSIYEINLSDLKIPANLSDLKFLADFYFSIISAKIELRSITPTDIADLLDALSENRSVTGLNLANNSGIDDKIIDPLISVYVPGFFSFRKPNSVLTTIDLCGTKVTQKEIERLDTAIRKQKMQVKILSDFKSSVEKKSESMVSALAELKEQDRVAHGQQQAKLEQERQKQEQLQREKETKVCKEAEHQKELARQKEAVSLRDQEEKAKQEQERLKSEQEEKERARLVQEKTRQEREAKEKSEREQKEKTKPQEKTSMVVQQKAEADVAKIQAEKTRKEREAKEKQRLALLFGEDNDADIIFGRQRQNNISIKPPVQAASEQHSQTDTVRQEFAQAHVVMLQELQHFLPQLQAVSQIDQKTMRELQGEALAFTGSISKEKLAQLAEQEKKYILSNDRLGDYYYSFIAQFSSTYIACKSIHSGKVKDDEKTTIDYVGQGIDALGKHIPGISVLTAIFSGAIATFSERDKKLAANKIATFFTHTQEADIFIEELARRLVFVVETEINQLVTQKVGIFKRVVQGAEAIKNWFTANDVDTVIKKLAGEHFKNILQAIIDGKLKAHPTAADLAAIIKIAVPAYQPQPVSTSSTTTKPALTQSVTPVAVRVSMPTIPSSSSSSLSVASPAISATPDVSSAELLKLFQEERAARLAMQAKLERMEKAVAKKAESDSELRVGGASQQLYASSSCKTKDISVDELHERVQQLEFWQKAAGPVVAQLSSSTVTTLDDNAGDAKAHDELFCSGTVDSPHPNPLPLPKT